MFTKEKSIRLITGIPHGNSEFLNLRQWPSKLLQGEDQEQKNSIPTWSFHLQK